MLPDEKICPPASNIVYRRPRLLDVLTNAIIRSIQKIITVCAPSGYGKSTLLADFAQTIDLPVCWCSLDSTEKNPCEFLNLLYYSLSNRFCDICTSDYSKRITTKDAQAYLNDILDLMHEMGRHVIIIDDYHQADGPGLKLTLNRLFQWLPETSTIILASQCASIQVDSQPLPYETISLGVEDLRFTAEEVRLVLLKRFGQRLSDAEAGEIAEMTGGHIGRILLAGQTMRLKGATAPLRKSGNRQIIDYCLAEDVFRQQSSPLQQFMLHTSVLPAVTAEMCNQLLGQDDAQLYLDELIRQELVTSKDKQWPVYQETLAEFLRSQLAANAWLHRQLSIKAAAILIDQSHLIEGLQLYLTVAAWDEAIGVLQDNGKFLRDSGHGPALYDWLTQIPEDKLAANPHLRLLQGQLLIEDLGSPIAALNSFRLAETKFNQQQDSPGAALATTWQAIALSLLGKQAESLDIATTGLNHLKSSPVKPEMLAQANRNFGLVHLNFGDTQQALTALRRALVIFEQLGDTYYQGRCHLDIGNHLQQQGHLDNADHHYQQSLEIFEALGNAYGLTTTLNNWGGLLSRLGRYEEALQKLETGSSMARQAGAKHQVAVAQAGIGDVYVAQRNYAQAIESYSLAITYAQEVEVRSLEICSLLKLAECFYYQHNFTKALVIARQANEIAAESGLTHEMGLAYSLQGRIYMRQGLWSISFDFFAQALEALPENALLEQVKVRFWWAYSLFLDLRVSAAFTQFKEAIRLTFTINELWPSLTSVLRETRQLLFHFLYWADTPPGLKERISELLKQFEPNISASRESLQVFMFGTPMLIVAGQRKRFTQRGRASKLPELLAYMLIEGQNGGCRWAEVTEAIWPDNNHKRASTLFHQSIRRLREAFFDVPDYILVRDDYYQINPVYCEWCDILAFERLYNRIRHHPSAETALPLQLELIDLYQGEFLQGFDLAEEWGETHRTEYEKRFLWTVKAASQQLLEQGLAWEALDILQKGIRLNYFQDDLHHDIFEAYARLGLYGEMRSHYEQLVKIFENDLRHPPDAALKDHFQQLISRRAAHSTKVEPVHRHINTF